ncbi:hypothetical protein N7486_005792 [Penicillium sp. IBT 16267x]|nr:hypothetical protein N7486_005792 [Penicillium sp. IBT 16267x]
MGNEIIQPSSTTMEARIDPNPRFPNTGEMQNAETNHRHRYSRSGPRPTRCSNSNEKRISHSCSRINTSGHVRDDRQVVVPRAVSTEKKDVTTNPRVMEPSPEIQSNPSHSQIPLPPPNSETSSEEALS